MVCDEFDGRCFRDLTLAVRIFMWGFSIDIWRASSKALKVAAN